MCVPQKRIFIFCFGLKKLINLYKIQSLLGIGMAGWMDDASCLPLDINTDGRVDSGTKCKWSNCLSVYPPMGGQTIHPSVHPSIIPFSDLLTLAHLQVLIDLVWVGGC